MAKSVFISHAVADRLIAAELVALIENGIGVPEAEIFCSSLEGYGIPTGENFVSHIHKQMLDPQVVIFLLTPAYFESPFCMSEMGAAWIKSHYIFPLLVPPLDYADIKAVLSSVQLAKVDEPLKYNELKEELIIRINFPPKSPTKWEITRAAYLEAIRPLLGEVTAPSKIPLEQYEQRVEELKAAQIEMTEYEAEVRSLKERLARTEELKDRDAISALSADYIGDENIVDQFESLTKEISAFKKIIGSAEVFRGILCYFYGKPYEVIYEYREEFRNAAQYGFWTEHDAPDWDNKKLRRLSQTLNALGSWIDEHEAELEEALGEDAETQPAHRGFWEAHFGV